MVGEIRRTYVHVTIVTGDVREKNGLNYVELQATNRVANTKVARSDIGGRERRSGVDPQWRGEGGISLLKMTGDGIVILRFLEIPAAEARTRRGTDGRRKKVHLSTVPTSDDATSLPQCRTAYVYVSSYSR